ncbi:MAG: hypothetical protein CMK59_05350 [Proteobacteria bacterium]|nr:hypothetical protein [Pseudomonadota bacterium]
MQSRLLFLSICSTGCAVQSKSIFEQTSTTTVVYEDNDNDGYYAYIDNGDTGFQGSEEFDCDDSDPNVQPGATEVCDGIDNDCDGSTDENVLSTFFLDSDGDGFGLTSEYVSACNPPEGYVPISNDCDDDNSDIYPAADEVCDGIDNNCNDETDENVGVPLYDDLDGDGYGDPDSVYVGCVFDDELPSGTVQNGGDCDDTDEDIRPDAEELCDAQDNNCNDLVDEELIETYYFDLDQDGYGNPDQTFDSCNPPPDYIIQAGDCDDLDFMINPLALEACDLVDNNCNGVVDENVQNTYYQDLDGDGYGDPNATGSACSLSSGYSDNSEDCDDQSAATYPQAVEYCDGADNDCDGETDNESVDAITWYLDIDGDGFGSIFVTQDACTEPQAPPGYYFVLDQSDCDDTRASVYPGAIEVCNGLDDDCDGGVDQDALDALTWYADVDQDEYGDPNAIELECLAPTGYIATAGDCNDAELLINPEADELCNGVDDNCDLLIDNDSIDAQEFFPDLDGDGYGDAAGSVFDCTVPAGYVFNLADCDDDNDAIFPEAQEYCDGIDQDCDGNNFYELDYDNNGLLACEESIWMRNSSSSNTGPYGSFSEAASYLIDQNITVADLYHGNVPVTPQLLENVGLYVHHGNNMNGALGAYTNAEASALEDWVFNGGRMLFMGYHSTEDACESTNSIPFQFGVSCDSTIYSWSGDASTFVSHPVTDGLTLIGALGGENWVVTEPAQILASVDGYEFVVVVEYGKGKVVLIADEWPYYNTGIGTKNINYADNRILVENAWDWLLE